MQKSRFYSLVEAHKDRIYTFAFYYLQHREEAEDVTQEVLLRLWHHRKSLHADRVEGWLVTVARNACRDALRRRKSYRKVVMPVAFDESLGSPDTRSERNSPQRQAEISEFQARVREALGHIREPYRSVLILREIQDASYRQISEALSLPMNTVKAYLHRGRRMLRKQLKDVINDA